MRRAWLPRAGRDRTGGRRRPRRAVSETVGGIILAAVLLTAGVSYITTTIQLNRAEEAAVLTRLRLDGERQGERINVTATVVSGNISATLFNFGPLPVQVAYVLVTNNSDGRVVGTKNAALVDPPVIANPSAASVPVVTDFTYPGFDVYTVTVVTGRGNILRDVFPHPAEPVLLTTGNLGFLQLNFGDFQFAQTDQGNCGTADNTWGAWQPGWSVPEKKCTVFRVNVTNLHPSLPINLSRFSLFFLFDPKEANTIGFWIMNATLNDSPDAYAEPDATKKLSTVRAYNESQAVIIGNQSSRWVYFGAPSVGNNNPDKFPPTDASYGTSFLMYATLGSSPYAQNLPFYSVRRA